MLAILLILCVPFAFVESFSANISRINLGYRPTDGWIEHDPGTEENKLLKDITEEEKLTVKYELDQDGDGILEENEVDLCGVDESSVDGEMVEILLKALGVEGISCPVSAGGGTGIKDFATDLDIDDKVDPENCRSSWDMRIHLKSPELEEPIVEADFFVQNNDCDYEKITEKEGNAPPEEGEAPPEGGEAPPEEGEAPPEEGEATPEENE